MWIPGVVGASDHCWIENRSLFRVDNLENATYKVQNRR